MSESISFPNEPNAGHTEIQSVSEILPSHLTILPLHKRPVFPGLTLPLSFSGTERIRSR
jgi:hypothetical protein